MKIWSVESLLYINRYWKVGWDYCLFCFYHIYFDQRSKIERSKRSPPPPCFMFPPNLLVQTVGTVCTVGTDDWLYIQYIPTTYSTYVNTLNTHTRTPELGTRDLPFWVGVGGSFAQINKGVMRWYYLQMQSVNQQVLIRFTSCSQISKII